jgi:hypothetical protein
MEISQLANYTPTITIPDPWVSTSINLSQIEDFATSTEDLLVMSVTAHRLRSENNPNNNWDDITNATQLGPKIIEQDRVVADNIRDFYSKKFLILALMERPLSSYRQDLSVFIHGDGKKYVLKTVGLAYRLPEFYYYDLAFIKMSKSLQRSLDFTTLKTENKTATVNPINKFSINFKRTKATEYWFTDSENRMYALEVANDNSLKNLWEREFVKGPVSIKGTYRPRRRDDITYFSIEKWELEI